MAFTEEGIRIEKPSSDLDVGDAYDRLRRA